ncbi:hypothetical protein DFQ26_005401 [Actinomortierella ambigua]|nr:hypothetical protein DFQ26_005401 [Actinomortierella ambigua]
MAQVAALEGEHHLEGLVLTNSDSQVQKEAVEVKVSRQSEQVIEDKAKDRLDRKTRSRHLHDEAARRAKMREERKQGQLIPVMDENGVEIEDHFISPRDLDGDGIPDAYVLLRPTDNSKYMMDVGLFDEDTAAMAMMVPVPPKPSSTESAPSPPPTPEPTKKPPVVVIVPGSQPIAPSHETLPSTDPPSSPQLPDPALSSDNKPSSEIVTDAAGSAQPTGSS